MGVPWFEQGTSVLSGQRSNQAELHTLKSSYFSIINGQNQAKLTNFEFDFLVFVIDFDGLPSFKLALNDFHWEFV